MSGWGAWRVPEWMDEEQAARYLAWLAEPMDESFEVGIALEGDPWEDPGMDDVDESWEESCRKRADNHSVELSQRSAEHTETAGVR